MHDVAWESVNRFRFAMHSMTYALPSKPANVTPIRGQQESSLDGTQYGGGALADVGAVDGHRG